MTYTTLTDESLMPFGIHEGKKMANVPDSYLNYLYINNKTTPAVKAYILDNMDSLKSEK